MPITIRLSRRSFMASAALSASVLLATLPLAPSAFAQTGTASFTVNVDEHGVALKGYDPVAYFAQAKPSKGLPNFSARHEGATYWFSSAANRDAFNAGPDKFKPAFGGYCAMGVALDKKLDIDPTLWRVVDGKLFLNVHQGAQTRWLEDVPGNIALANKNWLRIKDMDPKQL